MWYLASPPKGSYHGIIHLSTDGETEDCATRKPGYRERGGLQGDPKAEDLLALRLASRDYRLCRRCFKYGPRYGSNP